MSEREKTVVHALVAIAFGLLLGDTIAIIGTAWDVQHIMAIVGKK
jgi:hypothetical protein